MKKRGHTRDCLDAAEAYLPCICGTDEHNRRVALMTDEIPDITPIDLFVLEFHQVFGHPAPETLDVKLGSPALRKLRAELIREEFVDELLPALGLTINPNTGQLVENGDEVDVVEAADALTDILWVTIGAMWAFGMDPQKLMAEVHRSNMSKLGADGLPIYREDGKILKGPDYSKPDIKRVLGLI